MIILNSMLFQLGQLLKIVGWISLPLIVLSVLLTIILHYRRRRKGIPDALLPQSQGRVVFPMPAIGADGQTPMIIAAEADAFGLLQYGRQLEEAKLRYDELNQHYIQLQETYDRLLCGQLPDAEQQAGERWKEMQQLVKSYELRNAQLEQALEYARNTVKENGEPASEAEANAWREKYEHLSREFNLKQEMLDAQAGEITRMEHLVKEMQASFQLSHAEQRGEAGAWQEELEKRERAHYEEKQRLEDQHREMQEALAQVQEENNALQEQMLEWHGRNISLPDSIELDDLQQKLDWLEQERNRLKQELADRQAREDIVGEKDLQVSFIQQQLENRIRQFHELQVQEKEQQARIERLCHEQEQLLRENQQIREEAARHKMEKEEWQLAVETHRQMLSEMEGRLLSERSQGEELGRQLEDCEARLAAEQNRLEQMQHALAREQERAALLEKKLMHNIDLLKQMYEAVIGGTARQEADDLEEAPMPAGEME